MISGNIWGILAILMLSLNLKEYNMLNILFSDGILKKISRLFDCYHRRFFINFHMKAIILHIFKITRSLLLFSWDNLQVDFCAFFLIASTSSDVTFDCLTFPWSFIIFLSSWPSSVRLTLSSEIQLKVEFKDNTIRFNSILSIHI